MSSISELVGRCEELALVVRKYKPWAGFICWKTAITQMSLPLSEAQPLRSACPSQTRRTLKEKCDIDPKDLITWFKNRSVLLTPWVTLHSCVVLWTVLMCCTVC